jgi:hypothetical protein
VAFQAAAEAAKPREVIGRDCTKELVLMESATTIVRSVLRTQLFNGPWIGQLEPFISYWSRCAGKLEQIDEMAEPPEDRRKFVRRLQMLDKTE